ncbi:Inner membrane transport protein YajR [compost metagenome]
MGVYSTSQFLGVAIGGSLGGLFYSLGGAPLVFGSCAVLALLWLGISLTMQEPPYVSSLRIVLPEGVAATPALEQKIRACEGVSDVLLVEAERSLYVKVDTKHLTRSDLERLVAI